ncbi:trypsin alpha-like [Anopheles marshallii]|uniref:trypsin alpha-like n=1 Tax=Anopheles marshallii TaxID=1521116 RepID=UPI00237BD2E5|nr:trypsin alpha-like [Anopheles marshallii]
MHSPPVNCHLSVLLRTVVLLTVPVAFGQSNLTVPQPFNVSGQLNHTLPSNSLPPLATVAPQWNPIPHYQHAHYDPLGKVLWFPRIIGGALATAGEFPAMVSLQQVQNSAHVCGGTLITMSHVLTAAHCVTDVRGVAQSAARYQVMGDDLYILQHMGSPTRQVRRVASINIHPRYDSAIFSNDIAIVRVVSEFRKSDTFFPGKRIQKTPILGDRCSLAGWGVTDERSTTMSPNLQRINVVISDFGSCNAVFDQQLTKGMLCAEAPGRDACQGDSGGALLCAGGRVAGIVSFGDGCAKPNVPGVYVDVAYYEKWINGVLKNGGERSVGYLAVMIMCYWAVKHLLR